MKLVENPFIFHVYQNHQFTFIFVHLLWGIGTVTKLYIDIGSVLSILSVVTPHDINHNQFLDATIHYGLLQAVDVRYAQHLNHRFIINLIRPNVRFTFTHRR